MIVSDVTKQRRYYESQQLVESIDVGLLWRPGNQKGSPLSIANRPPTRMEWWWSHGVPTIGYPMVVRRRTLFLSAFGRSVLWTADDGGHSAAQAYLEGATRARYPARLHNITEPAQIQAAVCELAPTPVRACAQRTALRAAAVTSPQFSAFELLAVLCAAADACGASSRPPRPGARGRG